MHNRYFVEVDNEDNWRRNSKIDRWFVEFDEAVEYAKKFVADHDEVRVVDECYGRTWAVLRKGEQNECES